MKDFGEWFRSPERRTPPPAPTAPRPDPTEQATRKAREHLEEVLPDEVRITYQVPCTSCGRLFEWPVEIELYDPNHRDGAMCGGSPRCCP